MKKIYFISDVHLGIESAQQEALKLKRLLGFLASIEKTAERLIIVGDLFDFWFDYHWVIPRKHLSVISALKRLTESGVKVMYCIGNHDFWLGDFFEKDLNIAVYREPIEFEQNGRRFYITHGDGLNKKDIGYHILKTILRCPVTSALCKLMHPDLTFALARWFSMMSRNHRPDHDHREPYIRRARELFTQGYDFVIFGHTHDAMELKEDDHVYINTGEWMEQFTYAVYEKDTLQLLKWTDSV